MEYRFRELTTKAELLEHFRLRYKIYRDSKLKNFLAKERVGLDIDRYDLQSKHYGLFLISEDGEIMIGGLRTIYEKDLNDKQFIKEFLGNNVSEEPRRLPTSYYLKTNDSLDLKTVAFEASRLFVRSAYRNRTTTFFLVKSAMSILFYSSTKLINYVLVGVAHSSFYQRFGYQQLNRKTILVKELPSDILSIDETHLSNKYRAEIQSMASQLLAAGYISTLAKSAQRKTA